MTEGHIFTPFDKELEELKEMLIYEGGLVEKAIRDAMQSLVERDSELAKKVIKETGRDIGIKMTGIRLGETLNEKLMTAEEELIAKRVGKFFVIK